jgi:glycerol kinase
VTPKGTTKFILAVDQGTSGTGAYLFNRRGEIVASADVPVKSSHPEPGWVEQDPHEVLASIKTAVREVLGKAHLKPGQVLGMGVANQGECLLLWDRETGLPIYPSINWQDVRSANLVERMEAGGEAARFRELTGLPLDPEWPATKIPWALDNIPEAKELLAAGRLAFSMTESWYMVHLTEERRFATDHSTVSRSGLYNIYTQDWDAELLSTFLGSGLILPEIVDSADDFGVVDFGDGWRIPWLGSAIDQAAALLGQACITPGDAKVTYGTCAAFWYNQGGQLSGLNEMDNSIAWSVDGRPTYAIVGETITAGASIVWLRDKLKVMWPNEELSDVAYSAEGADDLVFVSALSGLGAPYWEPGVRGSLYGLTAGTGLEHLVRASLDAVAYSVRDLLEAFSQYEGKPLPEAIKVDGGMTANDYLMQFQADILGRPVLVPRNPEGTSSGVAFLAGLQSGFFADFDALSATWSARNTFEPQINEAEREARYARWREAVQHTIELYKSRMKEEPTG